MGCGHWSRKAVLTGHTDKAWACAFSPDSKTLASVSWDKTVRLWDTTTGEVKIVLEGHNNLVVFCIFSPDGQILASASRDKTVRLWDAQTGSQRAVLEGHINWVESCVFSPDGEILASAGGIRDNTLRLWDVATGQERAVLKGHGKKSLYSFAFSTDGQILASAGGVRDNILRLWDMATGRPISAYPCIGEINTCNFSPSGMMVTAGDSDGNVYILTMYGFEFSSFGICSEANSFYEQESSDDLICPYCKSRNPAGSKWCMIDGSRL